MSQHRQILFGKLAVKREEQLLAPPVIDSVMPAIHVATGGHALIDRRCR
jgi:hypothetical protein